MLFSHDAILAMIEGLRRVKRIPEREWLEPIIQRLEHLKPGERLIIERLPEHNWKVE